jgi:hypothetical protein
VPAPTRADLLAFLRAHRYAVQASTGPVAAIQAAVVGIAILDTFEIVFDTIATSRKARNLEEDRRIALVIGGLRGEAQTVQYEGEADRPAGGELEALREQYFRVFPDGRDRLSWPGLIHVRVRPRWLRYSDFSSDPPAIVEMNAIDLLRLHP